MSLVYCHRSGRSHTAPDRDGTYLSNFLLMMRLSDPMTGTLDPEMLASLEKLWIIGADHELTNSTSALLHAASSLADPMSCVVSAIASGYGLLHFGAAESTYRLLQQTGTPENVPEAIARHNLGKQRIVGIGHRVYKNKDPRVRPIKAVLKHLENLGREDPLIAVAAAVESQVSSDEFFLKRRLCVNADL